MNSTPSGNKSVTNSYEEKNNDVAIDIQGRLRIYFPILFELLGEHKLDWKTIEKVFKNKMTAWNGKYKKEGKNIRVEASFYNIIVASIEGNADAKSLLDYMNKLFASLILRLDKNERALTINAVYGLLTNINSMYRNFLGELCVLNSVKLNTNLLFVNVEVPVIPSEPKGKKIDFDFLNVETGEHLMIEIVNIHLNNDRELNEERINQLLNQKIQGKLNITGILKTNSFQLVPVIWGSFEELKQINHFYLTHNVQFKNTSFPAAFASFTYDIDKKVYVFGSLNEVIEFDTPKTSAGF